MFTPHFDLGVQVHQTLARYFTRTPRPTSRFGNIVRPFPIDVWTLFALSLFLIATILLMCNSVYNLPYLWEYSLGKKGVPPLNFYLFTYTKLSEPELAPWFKRWSTGRFVTLLWSVQALFMILFYTSNLRAHMVKADYEDPPRSLEEIAATGNKVYITSTAIIVR